MSADNAKSALSGSAYPQSTSPQGRSLQERPSGFSNVPKGLVFALAILLLAIAAMVIAVAVLRPAGG